MAHQAPGKHYRDGISLMELAEMFPDEQSAHDWFVEQRWGEAGRFCPKCGNKSTSMSRGNMAFWCPACRRRFSVRTGTVMERSHIPLRKWAFAIYLTVTSLKGVSSMKLHRDLKITQKSAWFMAHRIREAMRDDTSCFLGPVEADETYFGGKRRNMSNAKRKELEDTGRGAVGKTAVAGLKDRASNQVCAQVVPHTDAETLQGFVAEHADTDATVYTDDAHAYHGLPNNHESVKHSLGEFVKGDVHTNGVESFWSMLKRAHKGTFHKLSPWHLQRYVNEFAKRHNIREQGTIRQMQSLVAGMIGKRLTYSELIGAA